MYSLINPNNPNNRVCVTCVTCVGAGGRFESNQNGGGRLSHYFGQVISCDHSVIGPDSPNTAHVIFTRMMYDHPNIRYVHMADVRTDRLRMAAERERGVIQCHRSHELFECEEGQNTLRTLD